MERGRRIFRSDKNLMTIEQRTFLNRFAKTGRVIGVLQREGKPIPDELVQRRRIADHWLTNNLPNWESKFGFVPGVPLDQLTNQPPQVLSTSAPPTTE